MSLPPYLFPLECRVVIFYFSFEFYILFNFRWGYFLVSSWFPIFCKKKTWILAEFNFIPCFIISIGECKLENMRTLCVACHYDVTAAQCAERRKARANARKQLKALMNRLKNDIKGEAGTNIKVCCKPNSLFGWWYVCKSVWDVLMPVFVWHLMSGVHSI